MADSRLAALAKIADLTEPHVSEMIDVLVKLARTSKREPVRARAASKLLELHLLAIEASATGVSGHEGGAQRVVVVREQDMDEIERRLMAEDAKATGNRRSGYERETDDARVEVPRVAPVRPTARERFGGNYA